MALKDILANAKYGDDMVLSLPDGTTATVGEMRGMNAAERNALVQRQGNVEQAEAAVMSRINTLRSAGLLDDDLKPVTTRQSDRQIKQAVMDQTGMTEDDPLFGPLVKEVKGMVSGLNREVETLKSQLGQVAGVTKQAVGSYLNDVYAATYERSNASLPEQVRGKYKLEDAIKYATDHKFLDPNGRLEIDRAIDRMSWDDVKAVEREKLTKDNAALNQQRKELAAMQRPGISGQRVGKPVEGFNPVNEKGRTKSIDQAISEAMNDDQLWSSAAQFVQ